MGDIIGAVTLIHRWQRSLFKNPENVSTTINGGGSDVALRMPASL